MSLFKKATKAGVRLRMAITGPSGGGKTFSALAIASGLGGTVAVIDTEFGSARLYADRFDFVHADLTNHNPEMYVQYIKEAEAEGVDVLILDSYSHAWIGTGGALELVDQKAKQSQSRNTFAAWGDVTPLHNKLIEAMKRSRCHIIATMRQKVDYVVEVNQQGKNEPRKVGLAPVQREGVDYEFDIFADMDVNHVMRIGKTRFASLDRIAVTNPGEDFGRQLAKLLDGDGTASPLVIREAIDADTLGRVLGKARDLQLAEPAFAAILGKRGVTEASLLTREQGLEILEGLERLRLRRIEAAQQVSQPASEPKPQPATRASNGTHAPAVAESVAESVAVTVAVPHMPGHPPGTAPPILDASDPFPFEAQLAGQGQAEPSATDTPASSSETALGGSRGPTVDPFQQAPFVNESLADDLASQATAFSTAEATDNDSDDDPSSDDLPIDLPIGESVQRPGAATAKPRRKSNTKAAVTSEN